MRISRIAAAALALSIGAAACSSATADNPATTTTTSTSSSSSTSPPTTAPAATTTTDEVPLRVTPRTYEDYRNQPTACGASQPAPVVDMAFAGPEEVALDSESIQAIITTSCGDIVVELDVADAPGTVNSFVFLAEQGYYDGSASHRVLPDFVIQAGDPTATGRGGPGYVIADEFPEDGFLYERGVVAMANAGPGTTGSQFFLVLADSALPPQYSVLGRVIEGLDVMDTIATVQLARGPGGDPVPSTPLESIYVESVTIVR